MTAGARIATPALFSLLALGTFEHGAGAPTSGFPIRGASKRQMQMLSIPSTVPQDVISEFPDSMSVIAVIKINGQYVTDGLVGAFVNGNNPAFPVRGVSGPYYQPIPPVPGWNYGGLIPFSFLVYGTDGETFSFTYQDASGAQYTVVPEPYANGPETTISFVKDEDYGKYEFPLVLSASSMAPPSSSPSMCAASCGESTALNPVTGQCEITCDGTADGRRMAVDLPGDFIADVNDSVAAYLEKQTDLTKQLLAAKTDTEMREVVRNHMERFAKEDREQLFGQPAHA